MTMLRKQIHMEPSLPQEKKDKHVIGRLRPRAALSRPRSQFFTIRTSQLANNIYILDTKYFFQTD